LPLIDAAKDGTYESAQGTGQFTPGRFFYFMTTVTQSVCRFLIAQKATHNGPDLLERYLALDGMETQINVHRGDGEPVDGKANTYSDGVRTWGPIRIPWKANSVPEWRDYHLSWRCQ
jgi:hypothetical protein